MARTLLRGFGYNLAPYFGTNFACCRLGIPPSLCTELTPLTPPQEGIVFRVVVNADGNLEDGSSAHPDDLDRFEPWRQLFEKGSNCKVKRCTDESTAVMMLETDSLPYPPSSVHWIVNYELEKRFEEARVKLREILGCEPEEKQLFHGTSAANIES